MAIHLASNGQAQEPTHAQAATGRLSPIIDFTFREGTNRPIGPATAKALGLGEEKIPAIQAAILLPGESQIRAFGVSLKNTNDLFVALIDKVTRSGKVWLTSPAGEIRVTILTASNSPPKVVSNNLHADEFVEQIGIWLELSAPIATNSNPLPGDGESLGEDRSDASGTVREISDKFGHNELQKLYQLLNSAEFQSRLTNYNCGDPVPKLMFSVSLRPSGFATTRAVEIYHSPGLSPSGRTRCLLFGVDYLLDKAVAGLDPDPKQEDTREPHCDCSKRDSKEEWVTFPGPTEILAHAKVAAKDAARRADEAEEEKEGNLSVAHLDPSGVLVKPDNVREHLVTREKSLCKLPPESDMTLFTVDPSFNHWAYVIKRGGKQIVVLDGVEGKEYDDIPYHQRLEFSADGKHFAYVAKRAGKMVVVADGKEGRPYDEIEDLFHPLYSPDGQHLAYIASQTVLGFMPPKMFVVLDGHEQKSYELVEGIFFSPDSRHLAYNADKKWNRGTVLVVDEKEGRSYDQIVGGCFSPDGNRLAYVAYNRTDSSAEIPGMDLAVVDGKEGKAYRSVSSIHFSPDNKHVAYVAGQGSSGMGILVRDEVERKYRHVGIGSFSPDSAHLASLGLFETNWLVLIDGKKLEPQVHLAANERSFGPVNDLIFSQDSRHLAYISRGSETNWLVVLDGKVVKAYEGIAVSPVFSPDSQRLAYVIKRVGKSIPVLGGQEGNEYDQILTWQKSLEDGGQTIGLSFDEKGLLHAMAIRGREILRLEIELVKN